MKHLILTGVNGCGKTTLIDAISSQIGIHEWGFAGLYFEKLIAREKEKVEDIESWFDWLQNALGELFENKQLRLDLSLEDMCFKIKLPDREAFCLDEMASGYEALFHIFSEIVIRMEHQAHLKYDLPGIILIDEIELHLHISWQKRFFLF